MRRAQARAPGRVNLIGEHTDYNGGFVLPCAITRGTTAVYAPPDSASVHTLTIFTPFGSASVAVDTPRAFPSDGWLNYARGVLIEVASITGSLPAGTITVESDLPFGAGLSSSASFEIALALAVLHASGHTVHTLDLARLAQRAENEYTGARSGLMDQLAVLFARKDHALLIDIGRMIWQHVPLPPQASIVICNSMKQHALDSGAYNQRRAECEEAARLLGVPQLRDARIERLRDLPPLLQRRAYHVITENERVLGAVDALQQDDLAQFGALMYASHASLRDDFEVSCEELDILVEIARGLGASGARMTGGGFGGCTVNLVHRSHAQAFARELTTRYFQQTGLSAQVYDGTPADGATISGV